MTLSSQSSKASYIHAVDRSSVNFFYYHSVRFINTLECSPLYKSDKIIYSCQHCHIISQQLRITPLLVRLDAGVLDGGSALEVLLEPQLEGLANGGDDVLSQAAPTLQNKACAAVPTVLGHVCDEVQCVLQEGSSRSGEAGHTGGKGLVHMVITQSQT